MELNRKKLKANILLLAFSLEKQYSELNFKHHCYLRIAFDYTTQCKWDNVVKKPYLNNCGYAGFESIENILNIYKKDKTILLNHNQNSLKYRKK